MNKILKCWRIWKDLGYVKNSMLRRLENRQSTVGWKIPGQYKLWESSEVLPKILCSRMEYRQWIAGSLLVPGIKNLEAAATTKTHWFLLKIPRTLTTKSVVDKWVCVCMCVLCAHAHAHRPTYTPTCIRVVAVGRVGGRRSGKKGGWSRGQCCHGWGRERCQIPLVPRRTWMVRFDHPLPHAIS